jgi:pyruvate dehydrogenase E2 component (dihydrolipoamide acetyltransferase)
MRLCPIFAVLLTCACLSPGPHTSAKPHVDTEGDDWLEVDGAWLRIRQRGEGTATVVMVHGFGSRLDAYEPVQRRLAAHARTIAIDLRGFGKSERPDTDYGPERHARDVLAVMDALAIDNAVLVGHSYGGGVVLQLANIAPTRVSSLVLVSPLVLEQQLNSYLRWARAPVVGEYLFATGYRSFLAERARLAFHQPGFVSLPMLEEVEQNLAIDGTTFAALHTVRGMNYDVAVQQYPSLRAPVKVLWGNEDRVLPFEEAAAVVAAIPRAQLFALDGVGHMPLWEATDKVADHIQAVLQP